MLHARIAHEFPVLSREIDGKRLVYLDTAATSLKPNAVIDAVTHYYTHTTANVHRGSHALVDEATEAFDAARAAVARYTGAASPQWVIFTHGTTHALNLVAFGWARSRLKPGDEVIVSELEHHANLVPWQVVARETGARIVYWPFEASGSLDPARLKPLPTGRTRIVGVSALSNVLGTSTDLDRVMELARNAGAAVVVDAAQAALHPRLVQSVALRADFVALSAHKMLGPTGVGALIARPERLEEMTPLLYGGDMVRDVTREGPTFNRLPHRLEAGTPPIASAIGWGAAIETLYRYGLDAVDDHDAMLVQHARARFASLTHVRLLCEKPDAPIFSFVVQGPDARELNAVDVAARLDREGIALRTGFHCAGPLHHRLGIAASLRASCGPYTSPDDLDALFDALV